jgi:hypothetical protein
MRCSPLLAFFVPGEAVGAFPRILRSTLLPPVAGRERENAHSPQPHGPRDGIDPGFCVAHE